MTEEKKVIERRLRVSTALTASGKHTYDLTVELTDRHGLCTEAELRDMELAEFDAFKAEVDRKIKPEGE